MTVFITGIAGFLGRALALHLIARGEAVRGSSRSPTPPDLSAVAEIRRHRFGDAVGPSFFSGVDVVVHCAHDSAPGGGEATLLGTRALLRAAEAAGVGRQVYVSSLAARPDAITEYGRTKHRLEEEFLGAGHPVVRPGTILGPGGLFGRIARTVLERPLVLLVDGGRGRMIVVGTRDVCCALEVVARGTAAGVHNLYVPGTITMREVLTLLAEIRGRRPHFLSVPSGLLLPVLATAERLGFRMPVTSENLRGYRVSQTGIGNTHLPELVPDYRPLREALRESFAASDGEPGLGR